MQTTDGIFQELNFKQTVPHWLRSGTWKKRVISVCFISRNESVASKVTVSDPIYLRFFFPRASIKINIYRWLLLISSRTESKCLLLCHIHLHSISISVYFQMKVKSFINFCLFHLALDTQRQVEVCNNINCTRGTKARVITKKKLLKEISFD